VNPIHARGGRTSRHHPLRLACALCLAALMSGPAAAEEPLDFDPALLLEEESATPGAESAPASDPRAAKGPRLASSRAATPPKPDRTPPAAEAPLAPLEGELADYLAESTAEWSMAPGDTLRGVLQRWSQYAGWSIVWEATRDYPVQANLTFPRGTAFQDAVRQVMRAIWRTNPSIKATVYKNKVIVVTDDGMEASR
jgi:hypothetical protein